MLQETRKTYPNGIFLTTQSWAEKVIVDEQGLGFFRAEPAIWKRNLRLVIGDMAGASNQNRDLFGWDLASQGIYDSALAMHNFDENSYLADRNMH